jgi:hypothetical protein
VKTNDLNWLAGLLEGEGCFKSSGNGVSILLGMTDVDVVLRAQDILGPEAHLQAPRVAHPGNKPMNYIQINGNAAAAWMMTLWTLMGERRRQAIGKALKKWERLPGKGWNRGLGRKTECEHSLRKHYAHGLCRTCYARQRLQRNR